MDHAEEAAMHPKRHVIEAIFDTDHCEGGRRAKLVLVTAAILLQW